MRGEEPAQLTQADSDRVKMVAEPAAISSPLTKKDWADSFKTLESDLLDQINTILQPLVTRNEEIANNLKEVEKTPEAAMELSLTSQEYVKQLRAHETSASEQILLLEQRL